MSWCRGRFACESGQHHTVESATHPKAHRAGSKKRLRAAADVFLDAFRRQGMNEPMRVLLAPSAYYPNVGGIEELTRQLARKLSPTGGIKPRC